MFFSFIDLEREFDLFWFEPVVSFDDAIWLGSSYSATIIYVGSSMTIYYSWLLMRSLIVWFNSMFWLLSSSVFIFLCLIFSSMKDSRVIDLGSVASFLALGWQITSKLSAVPVPAATVPVGAWIQLWSTFVTCQKSYA